MKFYNNLDSFFLNCIVLYCIQYHNIVKNTISEATLVIDQEHKAVVHLRAWISVFSKRRKDIEIIVAVHHMLRRDRNR